MIPGQTIFATNRGWPHDYQYAQPRIVETRKLSHRKHRRQQGRFAVEGLQLLHMALDADYQPLEVFYCEALFTGETAPALLARSQQTDANLIAVSPDVLHTLSDRDTPQGIFATFALPDTTLESIHPGDDPLVIVLDRLRDPGNIGTILRTADAAGASAVILLTPGADLFDPKTVRASMGSLFNLSLAQVNAVETLFAWMKLHHLRVIGADATHGQRWTALDWGGGVALVLGNEAQGLSDDLYPDITQWAALPIHGKAESLNVAVAAGVLMYAWVAANQ